MIQRIQSVYLTFIILLCPLFFSGGVLNFADASGKELKLLLAGNLTDQNNQSLAMVANMWPLSLLLILIMLLSLITIFLYKNRKIQLLLAKGVTGLSVVLIIALSWYGSDVISNYKTTIAPGLKMAVPVLILLFSILAWRGILKDDRLVKSYDRLR
jgi:hypothetical protein